MTRLVIVLIVVIVLVTGFTCPVLGAGEDGPGGGIGGHHSGLSVLTSLDHPNLEKDMDGPGGGIGPF